MNKSIQYEIDKRSRREYEERRHEVEVLNVQAAERANYIEPEHYD